MRRTWAFLKQLFTELDDDAVTDVAAMMTYYAIFSLFPMLFFVVTMAMLVVPSEVLQEGVSMMTAPLPPSVGQLLSEQVTRMEQAADAGFAILSVLIALWGASRGAASFGNALNRMFQKCETRSWIRRAILAIIVTLVVAVLSIVALGLLVVGPVAGHAIADRFGLGAQFDVLWGIARWLGAGLLIMLVWAILYKFLPDTEAPFRVFTPGACIGVIMWIAVCKLFSIYLDHWGDYEETYGTLATMIVFLTWLWLSNLALLLGAEINDVLADFRKHRSEAAAQLADTHEKGPPPARVQPTTPTTAT
jgi:membrane protein